MKWSEEVGPLGPSKQSAELEELLRKSKQWWETATDEQKEDMRRKQRESWVRGEMGWPRDCPYR